MPCEGEELQAGEPHELRALDDQKRADAKRPESSKNVNQNAQASRSASSMASLPSGPAADTPSSIQERQRLVQQSSGSQATQQNSSMLRALFGQLRALFSFAPYRALIAAFLSLTLGLQVNYHYIVLL